MISHKLKCIFVPLSKVASTSIRLLLQRADRSVQPKYRAYRMHFPISHYKQDYPQLFGDYYKFGFVRNPWERLYSLFQYLKRTHWIKQRDLTFRDWMLRCSEAKADPKKYLFSRSREMFLLHLNNQLSWFEIDGKLAVDFIGRHERLAEDFAQVAKRLGIPSVLPRTNVTRGTYNWRDAYDDETRSLVAYWFARDIEFFGYRFSGNQLPSGPATATILHCPHGIPRKRTKEFFVPLARALARSREDGTIARLLAEDPTLLVITPNNKPEETLLETQLRELGVPPMVIAKDWRKWSFSAKIVATLKALVQSKAEMVLFLDARDVLLLAAPDRKQMDACLSSYGHDAEILFMPTRAKYHPCEDSAAKSLRMAPEGTKSPFLCSGGYYGSRDAIIRCLTAIIEAALRTRQKRLLNEDQRAWNWAFSRGVANIHVDWRNLLFARYDQTFNVDVSKYSLNAAERVADLKRPALKDSPSISQP